MAPEPHQYEWFRAEGGHDAGIPADRDPRTYPWGMFTQDGFALASVGMFMWFVSADELADYLRLVEPQTQDVAEADLPALHERIDPALRQLRRHERLESAREAMNAAQDDWSTAWWGTFDDLCLGDGDWVRELREQFLEIHTEENEDAEDNLTRAIRADEVEPFINFLRVYGF